VSSRSHCFLLALLSVPCFQRRDRPPRRAFPPTGAGNRAVRARGATDVVFRLLAPKLSENLGQQALVDNRPGGGSTIGMDIVAKSAPDGYTLGVANLSFAGESQPAREAALRHRAGLRAGQPGHDRAAGDFGAPVGAGKVGKGIDRARESEARQPELRVVRQRQRDPHGDRDVQDPDRDRHRARSLQRRRPRGRSRCRGQVPDLHRQHSSQLAHIKSGRLVALAVTSSKPDPALPGIPTVAEAGVPGYEAVEWQGIVVLRARPARHRPAQPCHRPVCKGTRVQRTPCRRGRACGGEHAGEFGDYLKKELATWSKVIKATGIKID